MIHLQINCNYLFDDLPCVAATIIRSFAQLPAFSLLWQRAMNFQRKLEFPPKIGFIVFRPSSLCTRSLHGFVQESFAGKSMIFTISPLRVSHPSWQRWLSVEIIPTEKLKIEQTAQYHVSWFLCLNWEQKSCDLFKKRDIEVDGSRLWRVFWSLAEPLPDAL